MFPPAAIAAFLMGFFPAVSVAGANAAIFLFIAAAGLSHFRGDERVVRARTPFDAAVLFFLAAWTLSSLAGLEPKESLPRFLSQTRFIPFYLLVWVAAGRYRERAFRGYLWGAAVAVAWGFFQAIFTATKAWKKFPALFDLLGEKGSYWLTLSSHRAHAGVHPLTYAEVILPFFLGGVAFFLESTEKRRTRLSVLWILAAGGALLLSQSRGPWLAAAAGVLLLAVMHPRRTRLALPTLLLASAAVFHPDVRARLETLKGDAPDRSRSHRLILWRNAWEVAERHPLTGVGPGNLEQGVRLHQGEPGVQKNPWGQGGDAHNQYLHHAAERGIFGLAALLWLLAIPPLLAFRALRAPPSERGPPRWVRWGLFAFFCAFPLLNVTERAYDDAEPSLVFWVLASLLVNGSHPFPREEGADSAGRSADARRTSS